MGFVFGVLSIFFFVIRIYFLLRICNVILFEESLEEYKVIVIFYKDKDSKIFYISKMLVLMLKKEVLISFRKIGPKEGSFDFIYVK